MEGSEQINFNGELFVLVDGIPVFSPTAKMIEDFKVLIVRDKGSKGDSDGRKKLHANKELAYIWFVVDRKSDIKNNYSEEERHEKAKRIVGLPEDWKADKYVEIAMSTWEEIRETQTSKVLDEIKESLFSSQRLVSLIRKKIDRKLLQAGENDIVPDMDEDTGVDYVADLMKDVNSLLDMSKKIPDMISIIEKLEEKVSKEKSDGKGKKGVAINKFQFPKHKR